ncbi:hypothetical protein [Desulfosporosinus youngiae]|uniref:Uncharacterized protein n=1 Tax=Desulfosporosinus youngiae DSM 17734 TaxID=768710 RepID=H5Y2E8_9FIRM|nr:hypothetical protein [Desulfosporosinus youngiae]EHQ88639.1 hypothetical protein DesyoDRAFT_1488 [Desulfosporosinus youngiae DSM 17734]
MHKQLLRRLRLIEGIFANIPFLIGMLLFWVMPLYIGLSSRVIMSLIFVLFLCSVIFTQRVKRLIYVRLLPFMKPLCDYEQQKPASDKSRRKDRIFTVIVIISFIFVMVYPPSIPKQINWEPLKYSISGSLIGLNIGMVWKALTEKFDL